MKKILLSLLLCFSLSFADYRYVKTYDWIFYSDVACQDASSSADTVSCYRLLYDYGGYQIIVSYDSTNSYVETIVQYDKYRKASYIDVEDALEDLMLRTDHFYSYLRDYFYDKYFSKIPMHFDDEYDFANAAVNCNKSIEDERQQVDEFCRQNNKVIKSDYQATFNDDSCTYADNILSLESCEDCITQEQLLSVADEYCENEKGSGYVSDDNNMFISTNSDTSCVIDFKFNCIKADFTCLDLYEEAQIFCEYNRQSLVDFECNEGNTSAWTFSCKNENPLDSSFGEVHDKEEMLNDDSYDKNLFLASIDDNTKKSVKELSSVKDNTADIKESSSAIKNNTADIKNSNNAIKDNTADIKNSNNAIKDNTASMSNSLSSLLSYFNTVDVADVDVDLADDFDVDAAASTLTDDSSFYTDKLFSYFADVQNANIFNTFSFLQGALQPVNHSSVIDFSFLNSDASLVLDYPSYYAAFSNSVVQEILAYLRAFLSFIAVLLGLNRFFRIFMGGE